MRLVYRRGRELETLPGETGEHSPCQLSLQALLVEVPQWVQASPRSASPRFPLAGVRPMLMNGRAGGSMLGWGLLLAFHPVTPGLALG